MARIEDIITKPFSATGELTQLNVGDEILVVREGVPLARIPASILITAVNQELADQTVNARDQAVSAASTSTDARDITVAAKDAAVSASDIAVDAAVMSLREGLSAWIYYTVKSEEPVFIDGEVFNGAQISNNGWSIPVGHTGADTYIWSVYLVGGNDFAGKTARFMSVYDTSPNLLNDLDYIFRSSVAAGSIGEFANSQVVKLSDNQIAVVFDYTFTGTEYAVRVALQVSPLQAVAASELRLIATGQFWALLEPGAIEHYTSGLGLLSTLHGPPQKIIRVNHLGFGDVTHPNDVNQPGLSASAGNNWTIDISDFVYDTTEYPATNFVNVRNYNASAGGFKLMQEPSTAPIEIQEFSTLRLDRTTHYYGLSLQAKNARYVLHSETSGNVKDTVVSFEYCDLHHYGNLEAIDYHAPAPIWSVTYAIGIGTASGGQHNFKNTILRGLPGGVVAHDNVPAYGDKYDKPHRFLFKGGYIVSEIAGPATMAIYNAGSGVMNLIEIIGQSLTGPIILDTQYWFSDTLDYQPADHRTHDFWGYGNTPEVFSVSDFGRALRIRSATTGGGTSVAVSGTAVPVLFGEVVSRNGGGGLAADAYGTFDVSGRPVGYASNIYITSLGQRLGNRTSSPLTLNMIVDGSPQSVTFDSDYTLASNEDILSLLNAALSGAGSADLFDVSQLYFPRFTDEERYLTNRSGAAIEKGDVVAFDNDDRQIRLMTNADEPHLFAGVALERMLVGENGRVKHGGKMALKYIARTDAGTPAFNSTLGISAVAGKVSSIHSGTPLFRVIRAMGGQDQNDAVAFIK